MKRFAVTADASSPFGRDKSASPQLSTFRITFLSAEQSEILRTHRRIGVARCAAQQDLAAKDTAHWLDHRGSDGRNHTKVRFSHSTADHVTG
jgi:hypothetical protein